MRHLLWVLLLAMCLGICGCSLIYDNDFSDSYRYKPECDISYFRYLGPEDTPQIPGEKMLK